MLLQNKGDKPSLERKNIASNCQFENRINSPSENAFYTIEGCLTFKGVVMKKIKVWDLPIRLFHWSLVVMIVVCIYTINVDNVTAHQYAGTFVLVLLLFRVLWGVLGSTTAKFWDFVKGPVSAYQYLRKNRRAQSARGLYGAFYVACACYANNHRVIFNR